MFKKILSTFGVKVVSAVMTFGITVITARVLGAEGRGIIGLFMASLAFVMFFNYLAGGSTLVYLSSRYPNNKLIWVSYFWAVIANSLSYLFIVNFYPSLAPLAKYLFIASMLLSLFHTNLNIILGREMISRFNHLNLLQVIIHFILITVLFLILGSKNINGFFYALFISYGFGFLISLYYLKGSISFSFGPDLARIGKIAIRYGFVAQLANISQLLSMRLSLYLLEYYSTTGAVGVFSTGTTFSESVWMIAGSMALIQYATVSGSREKEASISLSLKMLRLSTLVTFFALMPLLFLPEKVYLMMLGQEFEGIKTVIYLLSPGIIAIGAGMPLSHYFAGTGKYRINALCSGLGVIATILASLLLIPNFGIAGAALATSISYLVNTGFLAYIFVKGNQVGFKELQPSITEVAVVFKKFPLLFGIGKVQ